MAQVPNAGAAVVESGKLVDYVLSPLHPRGAAKARFLARFGFTAASPDALRNALLDHVAANNVVASRSSAHGTRYEVDGPLIAPDGRAPVLRVVWFIRAGESFPRLVALVPRRMTAP